MQASSSRPNALAVLEVVVVLVALAVLEVVVVLVALAVLEVVVLEVVFLSGLSLGITLVQEPHQNPIHNLNEMRCGRRKRKLHWKRCWSFRKNTLVSESLLQVISESV
jgi:hypothetical protein